MTWALDLVKFSTSGLTKREREALWARGVSDEQIDLFQIGYLNKKLPKEVPDHFLHWAQGGEKLNNMFVLPVTTILGEINGFQFRSVDKNCSGYIDYFLDRREPCLFGLGQAAEFMWSTRSIYLVEGAFDLFPIQRIIPFVVATLTSHVSHQTSRLFRRLVQKVWLGYDMDSPGRRGCNEFKSKHKKDFEVYVVEYPKKINGKQIKDPGELWEVWGDAQMTPFISSIITQETPF